MKPENRLPWNGTAVGYGLLAGFFVGYMNKETAFMLHVHTPRLVACAFLVWMVFVGCKSLLRRYQPTAGVIRSCLLTLSDKNVMGRLFGFVGGFGMGIPIAAFIDMFRR